MSKRRFLVVTDTTTSLGITIPVDSILMIKQSEENPLQTIINYKVCNGAGTGVKVSESYTDILMGYYTSIL